MVQVVAIGDNGVEPVVAAGQLNNYQDGVFPGGFGGPGRVGQELRHNASHGEK
jgi:hypothetical protein